MKISIERAVLLKAVSQAQSVVERRNTIPILANVLIEAEGDTVQFRATLWRIIIEEIRKVDNEALEPLEDWVQEYFDRLKEQREREVG